MIYFEKLYQKEPNIIEIDSPVFLHEVAILKDTVDNQILLRNTFANITNQPIIAVEIKISLQDVFGEPVPFNDEYDTTYVYQDILGKEEELFGNKVAIELPQNARKAEVHITKAVLQDGTVWKSNPDNIITVQPQREIEASDDFIETIDENSITPVFYYIENESCWQCTCGQANKIDQDTCRNCGREKDKVKSLYSQESIKQSFSEYRAKIEEEDRRRLESIKAQKENSQLNTQPTSNTANDFNTKQKKNNKNLIIGIVAAAAVLLVIVLMVFNNSGNGSSFTNKSTVKPITENGKFLPTKEIFSRMKENINGQNNNDYLTQDSQEGGMGFYHDGDEIFTMIVTCYDKDNKEISQFSDEIPESVAFYDTTGSTPDFEHMAYFVQSILGDMTYEQAISVLKKWKESRSWDDYNPTSTMTINGTLYYLFVREEANQSIFSVLSKNIDYANTDTPNSTLANIYDYDVVAREKVKEYSNEDAEKLLKHYREHENEYEDFNKLVKAVGVSPIETETTIEQKKTSTTKSSTTESKKSFSSTTEEKTETHTCLECGRTATHSILGLNNTLEWYCDEHWQEMQDAYNKIMGN